MTPQSLNAVYSKPAMRRRYEVWFLRLGLADGSGAWWFRYLLMNLGRDGCPGNPLGMPAQIWATWFPRDVKPQSFIQGFESKELSTSARYASPFQLQIKDSHIGENSCSGHLDVEGHTIAWDLWYRSTVGASLSDKVWIGFSRTPHSDAVFSGEIRLDGQMFRGEPLGTGLQGHNSGYRHRGLWSWTHCVFPPASGRGLASFEALEYEMPFGLRFRKALLWSGGDLFTFRELKKIVRDRDNLRWEFECTSRRIRSRLVALIDGSGSSLHRLPYLKTDCSSTFDVSNNSLARATLIFSRLGHPDEHFSTDGGAALEMSGD